MATPRQDSTTLAHVGISHHQNTIDENANYFDDEIVSSRQELEGSLVTTLAPTTSLASISPTAVAPHLPLQEGNQEQQQKQQQQQNMVSLGIGIQVNQNSCGSGMESSQNPTTAPNLPSSQLVTSSTPVTTALLPTIRTQKPTYPCILPNDIWLYHVFPYLQSSHCDLYPLRLVSKELKEAVIENNWLWEKQLISLGATDFSSQLEGEMSPENEEPAAASAGLFDSLFNWASAYGDDARASRSSTTTASFSHDFSNQSRLSAFILPSLQERQKDSNAIFKRYLQYSKYRYQEQKRIEKARHRIDQKKAKKRMRMSHLKRYVNPIGTQRLHTLTFICGCFWSSTILYFTMKSWVLAFVVTVIPLAFILALVGVFFLYTLYKKGLRSYYYGVMSMSLLLWTPRVLASFGFLVSTITQHYLDHPMWVVFVPLQVAWMLDSIPLVGFWIDKFVDTVKTQVDSVMILNLLDSLFWMGYYLGIWCLLGFAWVPMDFDSVSNNWLLIPVGLMQVLHVFHTGLLLLMSAYKKKIFANRYIYPYGWLVASGLCNILLIGFEISFLLGNEAAWPLFLSLALFELAIFVMFLPRMLTKSLYRPQYRNRANRMLANFFRGAV